ncbi:MAG: hypothetical protein KTR16_08620 [Acidiferrobacterales bacterium]|nr:hypothetical protein [Acidiferrobacterales bacterium]
MKPNERVELVSRLASVLEQLEGNTISIQELISHDYENREFDRHCTIQSISQMKVDKVSWQMSGGHFYLDGEFSRYGISTTNIYSLEANANEICILEKYETKTARCTKIKSIV